ncbi:MAG TPA: phosphatase PAP2 family protein [Alphaproteobacteria bacterium]|nr:phosphatase PAP2 family protein [Alphaproteobacteria bacterium]
MSGRRAAAALHWGVSGLVVTAAILVAILYFDEPIAIWAHGLNPAILSAGELFTHLGNSAWYLVPLGLAVPILFLRSRQTRDPRQAARLQQWLWATIFLFAAIALSGLLVDVLKIIFGRARPVLLLRDGYAGWQPFTFKYKLHSFPSGHANTVTALAVAVGFVHPRWLRPFLVFAVLVSLTRVVVGQHYLGDVIAGSALAVATTFWLRSVFAQKAWLFTRDANGDITVRHFVD